MKREEAKKYLSSKLSVLSVEMREAIKALEQESTTKNNLGVGYKYEWDYYWAKRREEINVRDNSQQ